MNRSEFLEYLRLRLDVINSDVSPSYEDDELYPFLDRAYLMVIDQQAKQGNFHFLKGLLASNTVDSGSITSLSDDVYMKNNEDTYPLKVNLNSLTSFYIHTYSQTKVKRGDSISSTSSYQWFPNDPIQIENASNVLITPVNKPYFLYPKVLVDYNEQNLIIFPDNYMMFDPASNSVKINYLKLPEKFKNLSTPAIHESLHHDVADKAANLAKIPINAQEAAQEVQVDEQVKRSES